MICTLDKKHELYIRNLNHRQRISIIANTVIELLNNKHDPSSPLTLPLTLLIVQSSNPKIKEQYEKIRQNSYFDRTGMGIVFGKHSPKTCPLSSRANLHRTRQSLHQARYREQFALRRASIRGPVHDTGCSQQSGDAQQTQEHNSNQSSEPTSSNTSTSKSFPPEQFNASLEAAILGQKRKPSPKIIDPLDILNPKRKKPNQ